MFGSLLASFLLGAIVGISSLTVVALRYKDKKNKNSITKSTTES